MSPRQHIFNQAFLQLESQDKSAVCWLEITEKPSSVIYFRPLFDSAWLTLNTDVAHSCVCAQVYILVNVILCIDVNCRENSPRPWLGPALTITPHHKPCWWAAIWTHTELWFPSTSLISKFRCAANVTVMNRNDVNVTVMNRNDSSGLIKISWGSSAQDKMEGLWNWLQPNVPLWNRKQTPKTYVYRLYINMRK